MGNLSATASSEHYLEVSTRFDVVVYVSIRHIFVLAPGSHQTFVDFDISLVMACYGDSWPVNLLVASLGSHRPIISAYLASHESPCLTGCSALGSAVAIMGLQNRPSIENLEIWRTLRCF